MDPATIIVALLGGGVSGAIFAYLKDLTVQRRSFGREDRYRFNDLKRERYAETLRDLEAWTKELRTRRKAVVANDRLRETIAVRFPKDSLVDAVARVYDDPELRKDYLQLQPSAACRTAFRKSNLSVPPTLGPSPASSSKRSNSGPTLRTG
jgi:hypothetical protein